MVILSKSTPLRTLKIESLNRDEMTSHVAEILDGQDDRIFSLKAEVRVLQIICGILLCWAVL